MTAWLGRERRGWLEKGSRGEAAAGADTQVRPYKAEIEVEVEAVEEVEEYGVVYQRPRCPRCGSVRIRLRTSKVEVEGVIVKYHSCLECRLNYKAIWE